MTRRVLCTVLLLSGTAAAQERRQVVPDPWTLELQRAQIEGRLRATMEMKTARDAPYSAEATTEFVQLLQDGNRIARKTVVRVFRDSEGRVRREHLAADGVSVESVTISDPVSRSSVMLDPKTRTAHGQGVSVNYLSRSGNVTAMRDAERKKAAEIEAGWRTTTPIPLPSAAPGIIPRLPRAESGNENVTRQDLGQRTIEGVRAVGTRSTTIIPAGLLGNEQPIKIVSEEWFSPDLQVLVLTKHSDPRSGETTYSLSNIARVEPDRSLFEVPPDYTRK